MQRRQSIGASPGRPLCSSRRRPMCAPHTHLSGALEPLSPLVACTALIIRRPKVIIIGRKKCKFVPKSAGRRRKSVGHTAELGSPANRARHRLELANESSWPPARPRLAAQLAMNRALASRAARDPQARPQTMCTAQLPQQTPNSKHTCHNARASATGPLTATAASTYCLPIMLIVKLASPLRVCK